MNKNIVNLGLVTIFALSLILPMATVSALPQPSAVGGGMFVVEHEDGLHRHFFGFSVKDPSNPKDTLHLVCMHDSELCMIIQSEDILSLEVEQVSGGSSAIFTGTARVKMPGEDWTSGWEFTVTVFDFSKKGSGNDVFILGLSNSEEHHMEGTLVAGNIIIKS